MKKCITKVGMGLDTISSNATRAAMDAIANARDGYYVCSTQGFYDEHLPKRQHIKYATVACPAPQEVDREELLSSFADIQDIRVVAGGAVAGDCGEKTQQGAEIVVAVATLCVEEEYLA